MPSSDAEPSTGPLSPEGPNSQKLTWSDKSVLTARTKTELKAKLDAGEPVIIIDLRHPLDLLPDPRTLPGAMQISPEDLAHRQGEITRDGEIVLFCT